MAVYTIAITIIVRPVALPAESLTQGIDLSMYRALHLLTSLHLRARSCAKVAAEV